MIVVIDPELKKLFFDRVMESCNFSPYDATKWIESVAYGEKVLLSSGEIGEYIEKIEQLQTAVKSYKEQWIKEKNKLYEARRKLRTVDEEIESYLDEIEQYRAVLRHSNLGEYI